MRTACSRRFCMSSRTWRSARTTRDFTRSWRRSRTRPNCAWRVILSCAGGAWAEAPGRRERRVRGTRRRARRRADERRRAGRARARLRWDDVWAARRVEIAIVRIRDARRRIARDAPPRDVPTTSSTSSSSTDWISRRASPSFRAGFCNTEDDDRCDETRDASRQKYIRRHRTRIRTRRRAATRSFVVGVATQRILRTHNFPHVCSRRLFECFPPIHNSSHTECAPVTEWF